MLYEINSTYDYSQFLRNKFYKTFVKLKEKEKKQISRQSGELWNFGTLRLGGKFESEICDCRSLFNLLLLLTYE